MDFEQISSSLLPLLGGKENIASAARCATRLRLVLVLVDDTLADQQAIGKIDAVKGCFRNVGQMQIIFGTGVVSKVYAPFIQAADIGESSKSEAAGLAAKKLNPFQRIARQLTNVFVPIIPAIVAAGIAVWFEIKGAKIKAITLPSAFSSMLGITEAAIFGINLRFVKPCIAALVGGAAGGAWVVPIHVCMTAVGLTTIPGMAIVQASSLLNYITGWRLPSP